MKNAKNSLVQKAQYGQNIPKIYIYPTTINVMENDLGHFQEDLDAQYLHNVELYMCQATLNLLHVLDKPTLASAKWHPRL